MEAMKERLLSCLAAVCLCSGIAGAQEAQKAEDGVNFVEGKTLSEALAMARESGKMVFVDCYTTWCGPCRMMSAEVFPQKKMGDYFNEKFVNLKVDMEKGEGPELGKRFEVRAYPTFLFLDAEGEEVNRIVGGDPDVDRFLAQVKRGMEGKGVAAMEARYDEGERDTTFLLDYLEVLEAAYDSRKNEEVVAELLKGREADMLSNPRCYQAFLKYNASPLSEAFRYVSSHKDEFYARYGKDDLDRMMSMAWMSYPRTFVRKDADGKVTYDKEGMAGYVEEMKKQGVENRDEIVLLSDINVAEATGDWNAYADGCSRYIKEYGAKDMYIYNWVLRIQKNCKDNAEVKAVAAGWMKDRIAALEAEKAQQPPLKENEVRAKPMIDFSAYYGKLLKDLEN